VPRVPVHVRLTDAGHDLVERTVDQVLGREAELVNGLPAKQRALLARSLGELLDDVSARVAARRSRPVRTVERADRAP
jgi:DNA-binding MarR family transcriptional regulator